MARATLAAHDRQVRAFHDRGHGRHCRRLHGPARRLRRCRHSHRAAGRPDRAGRARSHHRRRRRRARWQRDRTPAVARPRAPADLQLRASREPFRPAVAERRPGGGDHTARHDGRTHARRRRRHHRLLYAHRRRHAARGGTRDARDRRQAVPAGIPAARRRRADRGVERRSLGQPHLSRQRAELQSGDGDGGDTDHRHDAQRRGTRRARARR